MTAVVGIGGATRNACAAIYARRGIAAACEQERLTRVRGAALQPGALPRAAVDEVLALAGHQAEEVSAYAIAERHVRLPRSVPVVRVEHHRSHAATAFLTSPFARAAVLVCDRHSGRELSVWRGEGVTLVDGEWRWRGPAFASMYSRAAAVVAGGDGVQAHRLEALAHLGSGRMTGQVRPLFRRRDGALHAGRGWRARLHALATDERRQQGEPFETAAAVQRRLGELLLALLVEIRAALGLDVICLGGGLFYNTYFTTLIRQSGIFADVFVPVNPGNAGLAVGAALLVAGRGSAGDERPAMTPFLGREYGEAAIKQALDGCKLSYSFVDESAAIDQAVTALRRGRLVGWFQGRMEWGNRALGHRSILADPGSPYVLANLNSYLRKREPWRAFGVSVADTAVAALAGGPPASPLMEYEYAPRDERLRHVMPAGATTFRVQTVARDAGPFRRLHDCMQQATGAGALVNTSLNAFNEPIARSPCDAIRVFYGTGIDMLVMGRFLLHK